MLIGKPFYENRIIRSTTNWLSPRSQALYGVLLEEEATHDPYKSQSFLPEPPLPPRFSWCPCFSVHEKSKNTKRQPPNAPTTKSTIFLKAGHSLPSSCNGLSQKEQRQDLFLNFAFPISWVFLIGGSWNIPRTLPTRESGMIFLTSHLQSDRKFWWFHL